MDFRPNRIRPMASSLTEHHMQLRTLVIDQQSHLSDVCRFIVLAEKDTERGCVKIGG